MSSGGVSIPVTFEWSKAAGALAALNAAAGQTASSIGQAFQSIPTSNEGFAKMVEDLKKVSAAAEEIKSKGEIRVVLKGEGITETVAAFQAVSREGQALAGKKYTARLELDSESLRGGLAQARALLQNAEKGQNVELNLRVNADEGRHTLEALKDDIQEAEQKGVKIGVTIDTAGAARDVSQAVAEAQRKADAAAAEARRNSERAARETQAAVNQVKVNVTISGDKTTSASLRQIQADAKGLGGVIRYTITAEGKNVQAEIERVRQLIQGMNKGDSATVNLKMKADQAHQVTEAIKKDIEELRKRGGNIDVNINPASVSKAQSILQQAFTGAGRGAVAGSGLGGNLLIGANFTAGAAAGLGAAVVVQALTHALIEGTKASIEYNKNLELTRNTFEFYTGSATKAQAAIAQLRQLAAKSPLSEQQTLETGASFLRITGGDVERMQKLTELTTVLASARPELGFEKVQGAIQQLVSGDFEAFDDRLNITIGSTRELARQGFSGMELYKRAVEGAGGSLALMEKNVNSFSTRLSNFQQAAEGINAALGRGLFEGLSEGLGQANKSLSEHQQAWEALAEFIGKSFFKGIELQLMAMGINLNVMFKSLEQLALLVEKINRFKNPAAAEAEDKNVAQRSALNTQREDLSGQNAKETSALKDIERQLRANKTAQDAIKAGYEAQLIPLKAQLEAIQKTNFALQEKGLLAQKAQVEAAQKQEESLGDPNERAALAGQKFTLDTQHEILQLQQKRAEKAEEIGKVEQEAAHRTREAQITAQKAALDALRDEVQARNDARAAALEAIREEIRVRQEARQVAIEAIREEIRHRQEARQAALEALREEMRHRNEARQLTAEALREEIRGRQEARREAIEALQEEIRGRQEAREAALSALREEIAARRAAYDEQKQLDDNLAQEAERRYQNAERAADQAHRRSQDRYRQQIEQLRQRDTRLNKEESGKTPAERELEALEKATRERQRQQSIADAEAAVYNANTGRQRREAQHRLELLKVEQAEERKKEALKEQADKEREQRDQAREKRQEQIAELERKAQEEDRKYQREKEARDEKHRQEQEQLQIQQHERDEEERRLRHDEDARVKAEEAASRALEKKEQAEIRAAEKADRDATKAEEAQQRALEQAQRAQERADQQKIRDEEKKAKLEEQADQQRLKDAEAAAKAQERAENAQIRQQEQADKAQDRADRARIAQEEAALKEAERAEAAKKKAEEEERDKARLLRLQEMKKIEDEIDANRLKSLQLINTTLGAQAAADAVIADHLAKVAENLQKLDDIQKALAAAPIKAKIEAIEIEMHGKLVDLETARLKLEGDLNRTQGRIDDIKKQLEDINKAISAIPQPGAGSTGDPNKDPRTGLPKVPGTDKPQTDWGAIFQGGLQKAWDTVTWFFKPSTAHAAELEEAVGEQIDEAKLQEKLVTKLNENLGTAGSEAMVTSMTLTPEQQQAIAEGLEIPFISFQDQYMPAFTQKFGEQIAALNEVLGTNWEPQKVAEALERPFIDFQDNYFPAFQQKLGEQTVATYIALAARWQEAEIAAVLETPFIEFQDQYMPAFITRLGEQGTEAAEAFLTAWKAFDLESKVTLTVVPSGFQKFGQDAGEAFCRGWTAAMAGCSCPDCGEGGGGGGGGGNPKPGAEATTESVRGSRVVGEALPVTIASIRPSVASAAAAPAVGGATNIRGNVTVQVNNEIHAVPGMDVEALSEAVTSRTIDRVIDILDYTQGSSPNPVGRSQPGAL